MLFPRWVSASSRSSGGTLDDGPFIIGYAMCFFLMGVLAVQCFIYFTKFSNDRLWIRYLVTTVVTLETLFTIFAFHGFWVGVTANYSDLSSIVATGIGGKELTPKPIWSFIALAPLTGIVSTLTHGFFSWRIWAVQRSCVVPAVVMLVSVTQCIMVTYGGIVYGLVPDVTDDLPIPFYVPTWLSGSLFCDLAITVHMTIILLRTRSKARNAWSLSVKLAKLTVETGLITTTAATVELVLAIAFRVTLFHMAVFYIISKLYANCLLATLNARLVLRSASDKHKTVTVWEYTASDMPSRSAMLSQHRGGDTVIQIQKQVETDVELSSYPTDDIGDHKRPFEGV